MDVTHQPYDVFMQKNVLDPMGMKNSLFTQPPATSKKKLLATGYRNDGTEVPGKYYVYPEQAAAGLWTNPVDLCKYIIETQLSWKGQSGKVLTPEMTQLRLTPVLQGSAYGVFISKKDSATYFSHSGGNEGFRSYCVGDLNKGVGVAVMVNSDNGSIIEEIVNSVATVYKWKDYYKPVIKKVVEVPDELLDKYAGKYEFGKETVIIKKEGKDLLINAFGDLLWKMYFTSEIDFFVMEYKADMKFQISPEGKVTGFFMNGMAIKKVE
jgi:CubicO group peptidase (beta-lactamase class C family)